MTRLQALPFAASALAILASAGCGIPIPRTPRTKIVRSQDGRAHLFRYRREAGDTHRYLWYVERRSDGGNIGDMKIRETYHQVVFERNLGTAPGKFQKVFFEFRQLKRLLVRKFLKPADDGRKKWVETRENYLRRGAVLGISDNKGVDTLSKKTVPFYYLIMADGQYGFRNDRRYHLLWLDSPAYLFPVLPKSAARVGEEWEREQPMTVGGGKQPHVFIVTVRAKFVSLRKLDEKLCAMIEYEYSGSYDSSADLASTGADGGSIHHDFSGSGKGLWHFGKGRFIWKDDNYKIESSVLVLNASPGSSSSTTIQGFRPVRSVHEARVVARLLESGEKVWPGRAR